MLVRSAIAFVAALCVQLITASPGQANVWYVAANGTGTSCTAASPCNGLGQALLNVNSGDTIFCLSSPQPQAVAITKSVTIDCSSAVAPVQDAPTLVSGNEIGISIDIAINDPFRTVRLRGLNINGIANINFTQTRFLDRGIDINSAAAVYIEDCVIANVNKQGIFDHRTGAQTKLSIKNTVVSGAVGAGVVTVAAAGSMTLLDHVISENNAYGIAVGAGNNVEIRNSVFSGNSVAGVEGDSGSQIVVNGSSITHNGVGVQSVSSVHLSNNDVNFNTTALSGVVGTYGNNRLSGNSSPGTPPSALGGATSDLGLQ